MLERAFARPAVHVTVLALVAGIFCLARVASEPLDGDPAMYATIAKTIAQTGEWLHLSFNGEPYLNKPPLHFWLNALVFRVLSPTAFTAALVPGLFGVLDTMLVYLLARATLGRWETAFAAAIVYITTPEVVHWSRGVHIETLVTFWVLIGLFGAYRSVEDPAAVVILGVAALGGWFAKGPQGLFPAAVAVLLWTREGVLWRRLLSPWTLGIVAVVGGVIAWWVAARMAEESGFAQAYFGGQIEKTLLEGGILKRGPLWYVGKLFRSYWPWLPLALAGLVVLVRRWRTSSGARLWLVYASLVMVVISLAVGKKTRYLFQLYPALAVAAGVVIGDATRRFARLPAVLGGLVAVAALVVAVVGGERASTKQAAHTRDALEIVAALPPRRPIWITHATQYGNPQLGKILGFYGAPLLRTCRAHCEDEARPGAVLVARSAEAERIVARHGGEVLRQNASLSLIALPGGPLGAVRGQRGTSPDPDPHSR